MSRIAFQCSARPTTTAAIAPAVPAAMKLMPLQRKSSRHTAKQLRRLDSEIAAATRLVLIRKYVAIAPTSGFATAKRSDGTVVPPSRRYTTPVAAMVITSAATLKTVRYHGYGYFGL